MKTNLAVSVFSLFSVPVFSQEPGFEVCGAYTYAITQEALHSPKLMSDIIRNYPVNWISSYNSSEISASSRGHEKKAISSNDTLSPEQQQILRTADLGSKIDISISYNYRVPVTRVMEHNTMHVAMTVVPESEAHYAGGREKLMQYLKDNSPRKISKAPANELRQASILFTIDEQGKVSDARITRSSGNKKNDRLFLKLIRNMPAWKAAENPKGMPVKQEFEFIARGGGGC